MGGSWRSPRRPGHGHLILGCGLKRNNGSGVGVSRISLAPALGTHQAAPAGRPPCLRVSVTRDRQVGVIAIAGWSG